MTVETKVLFYLISPKFKADNPCLLEEINWKKVNFNRLLDRAARNRVLYSFVCNASKEKEIPLTSSFKDTLREVVEEGKRKKEQLRQTAQKLKETWDGKVDYYLFKTKQMAGSLPSDLDILFKNKKDYHTAVGLMEELGFLYRGGSFKGALFSQDFAPIEPHLTVSWGGREFFSRNFLFKDLRKDFFAGLQFKTLDNTAELGLRLAHVLFDGQYLIIRDFLMIKRLLEKVKNIQDVKNEAVLYGWSRSFERGLFLIQSFDKIVFQSQRGVVEKKDFPFWFPPQVYFKMFLEKAIFDQRKGVRVSFKKDLFMLSAYLWKRVRYFFPRRSYFVHSWLY